MLDIKLEMIFHCIVISMYCFLSLLCVVVVNKFVNLTVMSGTSDRQYA